MLRIVTAIVLVLLFVGCGAAKAQPQKKTGMSKAAYDRQNSAAKESHQGLNQE